MPRPTNRHRTTDVARLSAALLLAAAACADRAPTAPAAPDGAAAFARGAPGAVPKFEYVSFEVPGSSFTLPWGINAAGDIVGTYLGEDSQWHGFLLRGGEFTTIDYPDAVLTEARGIGPGGDIVGNYILPGEPGVASHGFRMTRQGTFETLDHPGYPYTILQRILPDGSVLGCRHVSDFMGTMRGVMRTDEGWSEIGEQASMHNGATPDLRRIVGRFTNMETGRIEGYVIDDGVLAPFVFPAAGVRVTLAWDVNPAGEIVGIYVDGAGRVHGFLRSDDAYTTIDFEGATATRAFGINARGDVVGNYTAGGRTRGFLARRLR